MSLDLNSLPFGYQQLLYLASKQYNLEITLLDELGGGRTSALVYLASVTRRGEPAPQHLILKLDHLPVVAAPDEIERHAQALSLSPNEFSRCHMPELAYEMKHEGCLAVFYAIAGQSLLQYHPLSAYRSQSRLETIFRQAQELLLDGWNARAAFERQVHPRSLLERWLTRRIQPGGPAARFLQDCCRLDPEIPGFLIQGQLYPNPLAYATRQDLWDMIRPLDILSGMQHGDLNINNLLVRFADNQAEIEGSFLIDFALFKPNMPLFYDLHYLEVSYLLRELESHPLARWVEFVGCFAAEDTPDFRNVPVELAGACSVLNAGRAVYRQWVNAHYPSLVDDLWAQYWLAGVAAGLNYSAKRSLPERQRLAGMVFAAAHLRRCLTCLELPLPAEGKLLYPADPTWEHPLSVETSAMLQHPELPGGQVTFLFSDIEGSTRLWQAYPEEMPVALAQHDALLGQAVSEAGGMIFKRLGDGACAAFSSAGGALQAALEAQRLLQAARWGKTGALKVRMGLHSGDIAPEGGDYLGTPVNQAARLMSVAAGGQVLVSQETYRLLGGLPEGVEWLDLGEHWLKDLVQPVHIWQPLVAGLPAGFPPLPTVSLLAQLASAEYLIPLVGRQREIAEIGQLLKHNRLVTICGPGGIGKTRLALSIAEELGADYRQGAAFVPLLSHDSPSAIVPAIAQVLRISLLEGRPPQEQLLEALRARELLLVIDNLEHLLVKEKAAATLALIEILLEAAPGVHLLATSREMLRLPQEQAYILEGLAVAAMDALAPPAEDSAVQLFYLQAERVAPQGYFDRAGNVQLVRSICRAVDGMPLAIELAAAQLRLLSLEEIVGQIENSLDVLDTSLRGAAARHQSIRLVFSGTWQGLEESERLAFARLSVFEGGFTLQSASQVTGATLHDLTALIDKSLITRSPDGRMSCHALIHRFAAEKLAELPGEPAASREKHYHFFNHLLTHTVKQWVAQKDLALLDALRPEADNLRLACTWSLECRQWAEFNQIMDGLWIFYRSQGRLPEAMELLERGITDGGSGDAPAAPTNLGHWEFRLGQSHESMSQLDLGQAHYLRALQAYGWPVPTGNARLVLGITGQLIIQILHRLAPSLLVGRLAARQLQILEVMDAFQSVYFHAIVYGNPALVAYCSFRMLNLSEAGGLAAWMARSYAGMGVMLASIPLPRMAGYYVEKAEANSGSGTPKEAQVWISVVLGWYYADSGEWQRSDEHFSLADRCAGELNLSWSQENAWVGQVWTALLRGQYARALGYCRRIEEGAHKRGDLGFLAAADYWQAAVYRLLGRLELVPGKLQRSYEVPPSVMNPFDWIMVWITQALLYLEQGNLEAALSETQKFLRQIEEKPSLTNGAFLYGFSGAAQVYLAAWEAQYVSRACPDPRAAARKICQRLAKAARSFPAGQPWALLHKGRCFWLDGQTENAFRAWLASIDLAGVMGMPYVQGLAHYELGRNLSLGEVLPDGTGRAGHLQQAARIFGELGTAPDLQRVTGLLDESGPGGEQYR